MALLWCDGFDHYGTDEGNMLDGVYAATKGEISTAQVATGTRSFLVNSLADLSEFDGLRKVLPTSKTKMGIAGHFYFPGLPTTNASSMICAFHSSNANRCQISVNVDTNGAIRVYRGQFFNFSSGGTGTLIATSDPLIVSNAWNHIEVQVNISDTVGWVRVAVNGVHRWESTGLDTQHDSSGIVSVSHHKNPWAIGGTDDNFYMDNLYYYDFVGTSAVDTDFCPAVDGGGVATNYIGELQCMYLPPDGDSVTELDWQLSTGSDGFALVDETTPNDADYIYSTTATDLSEFELTDLPEDITYIRGLQLLGRMGKSDAGSAMTKFGMNSNGTTDDADERPITVEPTYWWDFMNVDPDSGSRWTRESLNAALFRLTRSV